MSNAGTGGYTAVLGKAFSSYHFTMSGNTKIFSIEANRLCATLGLFLF